MFVTVSVILTALVAVLVLVALAAGILSLFGCRFRRVFVRGLWFLLLPVLLFFYGMLVERNIYKVSDVEVSSPGVPFGFDGYRIVQISDLHLASFRFRPNSLERAVKKINSLEPDLVLFTGDMVTSHPSEMDGLEDILSGIKARDGVLSVLGNHDYCIYHRWASDSLRAEAVKEVVRRQEAMGWRVLMNSHADFVRCGKTGDSSGPCDTISVAGVENISESAYFPSYGDLDKAMSGVRGSFRILMTHDPTHWRKALSGYPCIDLTLSGHTHAMQFSVFGWSPSSLMFPENRGLYSADTGGHENLLYVNIGLGETAIPSRIGTPPEITLITLRHRE
ncbi:MAG: metallophosphoesterase [Bacteroidetes bacterium]|uniref:Metallophosphoesterase n=1 Tax=Candidatus Cryptobacteroides excrementipullorum TaxID=2840761 RepID=A0A9D9NLR3_9BACT|nr:metallophosphoesterase [Candidatus Cryptobacteroides excrementipullorum]